MVTITCTSDLTRVAGTLPALFAEVIRNELDNLLLMLDQEKNTPDFRIDSVGYRVIILGHFEPESNLKEIGLTKPYHQVEYIETIKADKAFYRILVMHDNECFSLVLSLKESQNTELEAWLSEQCEERGNWA